MVLILILRIVYSDLEIDNILKANDKLKLPIIVESDKTEHICSKEEEKGLSNIARIGYCWRCSFSSDCGSFSF